MKEKDLIQHKWELREEIKNKYWKWQCEICHKETETLIGQQPIERTSQCINLQSKKN